jgi:hypothetical protein
MVRKNMFDPSVLKKYLDILDIIWLIPNKKKKKNVQINKQININKYFSKIKDHKNKLKKKELIILGYYLYENNNKIYLISDSEYKFLYLSIGICNPLFWLEFTTKTSLKSNLKKIIKQYSFAENTSIHLGSLFKGIVYSENNSEEMLNIKKILISNNLSDNLVWGSAWKDYPFRNQYLKTKNINFRRSMNNESLKQLNNIFKISCKTRFSKSIVTFEYSNNIITLIIKYNPIINSNISDINNKLNTNYPDDIPLDVLGILDNIDINNLSSFLELYYSKSNNLDVLMRLIDNINFKNELETNLKKLKKKTKNNKFKNIIKNNLKKIKDKVNNMALIRLKYKKSSKSHILEILDQKLGIYI